MPKHAAQKLTHRLCKAARPPTSGCTFIACSETRGLELRLTAAGNRAFIFRYTNAYGKRRRITIGPYPQWSLLAARQRVTELRQIVDRGEDPLETRERVRAATSVMELWAWHECHAFQKLAVSSQRNVRSTWERLIIPNLGPATKLINLRRSDVQLLVDKVTLENGRTQANRVHSYLRRALNLAVAEGWLERNVATMAISRNSEQPRERFLTREEFLHVLAALSDDHSVGGYCLRFIALTGCRKSEAMQSRWQDVELDREVWTKPAANTKARRRHIVPLSRSAIEVLEQVREVHPSPDWIFRGRKQGQPITELRGPWRKACNVAGLTGVRIHDLRHSFASFVASNGGSLAQAGALLGHSQPATTARYVHLFDDRLRELANEIAQ